MSIAAYPKYESYKDSGEGWLGKVPAHWESRKLKQLFQEKKHRANMDLNCGAISFGEVVEKDDDRIPLATKASYQEVLSGEFLVNPLNLNYDLKSLRIGLSTIDVVVSAGYIVLQGLCCRTQPESELPLIPVSFMQRAQSRACRAGRSG